MNIAQIITISPDVQSGEPVFAQTRVPIKNLFDYLKAGDTTEAFLRDFPSVRQEQVIGLLSFFEDFFDTTSRGKHENTLA